MTSRVLLGTAALLWLTASFLPLTAGGSGSTLSSHRLADLIASGALAAGVPPWVGLVWYAMPICAALLLMTLGLNGRRVAVLRLCVALLAIASVLGFGAFASKLDISLVGAGLWCGVAGSVCAIAGFWFETARLARGVRSPRVL